MNPAKAKVVRKFGLTFMYGIFFVLILVGLYIVFSGIFDIRTISVVGTTVQVAVNQNRLPRSLLFFPSAKIRTQLLKDNPVLADIRFEKEYPHTLVIVPTLRVPAALLVTPNRRVFIDAQGVVLSDADTSPVGLVHMTIPIDALRIGQKLTDSRVMAALAFMQSMRPTMSIETITMNDEAAIEAHTGNLDILFTQEANISTISGTLQTLIAGFRIKGTLPKVIDLRFDKPVVTF